MIPSTRQVFGAGAKLAVDFCSSQERLEALCFPNGIYMYLSVWYASIGCSEYSRRWRYKYHYAKLKRRVFFGESCGVKKLTSN